MAPIAVCDSTRLLSCMVDDSISLSARSKSKIVVCHLVLIHFKKEKKKMKHLVLPTKVFHVPTLYFKDTAAILKACWFTSRHFSLICKISFISAPMSSILVNNDSVFVLFYPCKDIQLDLGGYWTICLEPILYLNS